MSDKSPPESSSALPEIRIGEIKDVPYVSMQLDVDDASYDKLIEIGKDTITEKDYFQVGFTNVIQNYLDEDGRHSESSEILKGCIRQSLGNKLTEEDKNKDA